MPEVSEKYDRLIATLPAADGYKELFREWDELNCKNYVMDDYEKRYYEETDEKDVSKIRDKKWWQEYIFPMLG